MVRFTYCSRTAYTGNCLRCIWMSCELFRLADDNESFLMGFCLICGLGCFDVLCGFFATGDVEPDEFEYVNFRFKFWLNGLDETDIGLFFPNIVYFESISCIKTVLLKKCYSKIINLHVTRITNVYENNVRSNLKKIWDKKNMHWDLTFNIIANNNNIENIIWCRKKKFDFYTCQMQKLMTAVIWRRVHIIISCACGTN